MPDRRGALNNEVCLITRFYFSGLYFRRSHNCRKFPNLWYIYVVTINKTHQNVSFHLLKRRCVSEVSLLILVFTSSPGGGATPGPGTSPDDPSKQLHTR